MSKVVDEDRVAIQLQKKDRVAMMAGGSLLMKKIVVDC